MFFQYKLGTSKTFPWLFTSLGLRPNSDNTIWTVWCPSCNERINDEKFYECDVGFSKYYLLASWDTSVAVWTTYKIAHGRWGSLIGQYVDKDGMPFTDGGGEVILTSESNQVGPGAKIYSLITENII